MKLLSFDASDALFVKGSDKQHTAIFQAFSEAYLFFSASERALH